jgi:hypothetical protein
VKEDAITPAKVTKDFTALKFEEMKSFLEDIKNDNKLLRDRVSRLEDKFVELIEVSLEAQDDITRR